jgi:ATP-binding cassette, subfamily B, bacterial MsbA
MRKLGNIIGYAFRYKGYALLNVLSNVLYVVFNLLSLLLFIPFLRLLFGESQPVYDKPEFAWTKDWAEKYFNYLMGSFVGGNEKLDSLVFICITILVLFFLKNFFRYLAMFFLAVVRHGVVRDLREDLYNRIIDLPIGYFTEERKGDMIARLTNDVQEVNYSIMSSLELVFRDPISILISLAAMFIISPQLTLMSLVLMPLSALVISRVSKSLKRTSAKVQQKFGELVSNIEETLSGVKIIKAFNAQQISKQKFKKHNDRYSELTIKAYRKLDLASPMSEFLGAIVMVTIVWYGGSLILGPGNDAPIDGGQFIGFIIVFSQVMRPVQAISSAYSNLNKGAASLERIEQVMKAANPITEKPNAQPVHDFKTAIRYESVSFSYDKSPVLKNINLVISKGTSLALVGESGGGKSTLADLLPRFYDPTSGKITIDGIDLRDMRLYDVRNLFGIVTQQSVLFNDTVFNNIAFGMENASLEAVEQAARVANAHEFITKLEHGYDTNIGDSGNKLSGGQRQRLSIARAVLKNPPILILDEATSALDTESEKLVQDALFKLMKNRTSLIIAHRLSTIQHCDEILVMKDGEVIERGHHQELLDKGGVYHKLIELQSFS